jgi:hypothetical protein
MQLKGKVVSIKDVEVISDKFQKQIVLVEQDTKFDAIIPVEFINQKIDLVKNLEVGETKTFNININGREWKDRYFVSIRCYGISNNQTEVAEGNEQEQKENLPF